ncbi:TPA: AAA family ATPase, partial [Vibrio vulnificus]|nr:AAA family ATPase [Vibrio vulnificus]HAS6367571.1 AAA family ATPase [Vibrio vulnificus]HDY7612561.1 AAA family ATPase [Vibrio vulnificus]HDY8019040.1 AAA family ATPase [Vibrio vulnificus]
MFKINNVSSEIHVRENKNKYGFKFNFNSGLNIIKGQNSTDKSSILSCIYYNLGMEQLLGMSTSKTSLLDKCLTSEFVYKDTTYSITQSMIRLEIENNNGEIALIERPAMSPIEDDRNTIIVLQDGKVSKYYLHSAKDHSHKFGFYTWLQTFIGIELPRDP